MECTPKDAAAIGAVKLVRELVGEPRSLGVGTGSTVGRFLEHGSSLLAGVEWLAASSLDTAFKLAAKGFGHRVVHPASMPGVVDVYVDGADEVDPRGRLVKGRGAALLGEKILAYHSRVFIVIVDESKLVSVLGSRRPVPVEVVRDALPIVLSGLRRLGFHATPRSAAGKDGPVISDWGGVIVDVETGPIVDPEKVEVAMKNIPGVVETGLFIGLTDYVVVGMEECKWRVIRYSRTRGSSVSGGMEAQGG